MRERIQEKYSKVVKTYGHLLGHLGDHSLEVGGQGDGWLVCVEEEVGGPGSQKPQRFPLKVLVVDVSATNHVQNKSNKNCLGQFQLLTKLQF